MARNRGRSRFAQHQSSGGRGMMSFLIFLIVVLGGGFVVLGLVEVEPTQETIEYVIPNDRFAD